MSDIDIDEHLEASVWTQRKKKTAGPSGMRESGSHPGEALAKKRYNSRSFTISKIFL